jgi:nucleoside-diphosphate-sugar epimerase
LFENGNFGPAPMEIESLQMDIRDVERAQLDSFEAIIHLAGISNDPLGDLNPQCTFNINHKAAVRLAKLARDVGVRKFLFASSCSNYGAANRDMLDEHAPFQPVTPYGKSKVLVERDVSRLADHGFSPVFLRGATVYGASPRLRADLVVNNLTGYAMTQGKVLMKSDGTPWRPLVHVEDISRAYLAILNAPLELVHNQAFNVGRTSENYQIREVAKLVEQTVPNCEICFADEVGPDLRNYKVDCRKLEALPGYEPQWTVARGIERLYEAYVRNGLDFETFIGPTHLRLNRIKWLIEHDRLDANLRWVEQTAEVI